MPIDKLVSVIILAYNQEKYIQDSINSVINQKYSNIEIIVNDDYSSDKTFDKIQEIKDSRIKYLKSEYNKGINASLDSAIREAKGEFIILLAGDDMMAPNYLEKVLGTFEKNPDIGVVYCNLILIDENNKKYKSIVSKKYYSFDRPEIEQLRHAFLYGNFVSSPGMAVRSKDLKAILPLPYSIVNNQDFKMHIDMIINGVKNIVLDDKLILYRRFHNKTNISSKSFKTELRESLEFENVMDSFLKIKDINLLEKMFEKEIKQTGIKPYPDTIPYFLGRMAIYVKKDAKKSWGYHKIINFLKDKKGFDLVQKRYGLSYNDFLNLTQEFHNTTFERCFKYKKLFNLFLVLTIIFGVFLLILCIAFFIKF